MADARVVRLDSVDWIDFDMPGGSEPVKLAPLRTDDATRAPTALVRFPATWRREASGHYEAAEELVVLEGTLLMSGESYVAPAWGYVPAGARRVQTSVDGPALAIARFDGRAHWVEDASEGPAISSRALGGFEGESPLGARGTLLRRGDGEESWWVEHIDAHPAEKTLELIDPGARVWAWIPRGETTPALDPPLGPCVCRIIEET